MVSSLELDFSLNGSGPCSRAARSVAFTHFAPLAEHVRNLPYGRVPSEPRGVAVLREGRGTCSSKHQLLAALARECDQRDVALMIGLYRMSERTNPGIGAILAAAGLDEILEAHCYLTYQAHRFDFTGLSSGVQSPFEVLMDERAVVPEELPAVKVPYHREALTRWAQDIGIDFQTAWGVREQCIGALSGPKGPTCHPRDSL